jgi:hypothetical protein
MASMNAKKPGGLSPAISKMRVLPVPTATPLFQAMFGLPDLPLHKTYLEFEVSGVPPAVPNALRRAMTDEMRGSCLMIRGLIGINETADPLMFDQVVRAQVTLMPLRPQIEDAIAADVRFSLDVRNTGSTVLSVYSGDLQVARGQLTSPLFNPTFVIAKLQPGRSMTIADIYISRGYGRENAAYNVCSLTTLMPTDLARHPQAATHNEDGAERDRSGFIESSLVARPRSFRVRAMIPAAPDDPNVSRSVAVDACANIKERLGLAIMYLERSIAEGSTTAPAETKGARLAGSIPAAAATGMPAVDASNPTGAYRGGVRTHAAAVALGGAGRSKTAAQITADFARGTGRGENSVSFHAVRLDGGYVEGRLHIDGETDTIGNLLKAIAYELAPEAPYNDYTCIKHDHEMCWTVRLSHEEVAEFMLHTARRASEIIDQIQKALTVAPIEKTPWARGMAGLPPVAARQSEAAGSRL